MTKTVTAPAAPLSLAAARHARVLLLLAAVTLPAGASAASQARAAPSATRFACQNGVGFNVAFVRGGAWVTTRAGRWLLRRAPSSIGKRYASPGATFILDEDRAALVGLPGGPFLRCTAARATTVAPRLASWL